MKLTTETLRAAGLELMKKANMAIKRDLNRRGQLYRGINIGTVRLRTNNDRNLPCKSTTLDPIGGVLDIEGTDYICWVVPVTKRGTDQIEAYFIPTDIVVGAVKEFHHRWMQQCHNGKGANFTPALFLDKVMTGETLLLRDIWQKYRIGRIAVSELQNLGN